MFRPESDWSGQGREGVARFAIEQRFAMPGARVDIRRFDWVAPTAGHFAPGCHYLDFSLAGPRRSLLKTDAWADARYTGDILYLPPGFVYWGEPAMQHRRLLCLALEDTFLDSVFEGERALAGLMPCVDLHGASMRRRLEGLAQELTTPGFASESLLGAMLVGVAVELARTLRRAPEVAPTGGCGPQVSRIGDYVMANLANPLDIAAIARACGLSTRHVARVFKDNTGLGLGEFVTRSRIALARELLEADGLQVKEISWRCGFRSTSAFSAAFRLATGLTPREYREGHSRLQ